MKTSKFSKKTLTLIGLCAGLIGTSVIVTPLVVSCATNDPSRPEDTDGKDRKYNITSATYDNLEQQFIFKYEQQQLSKGLLGAELNKSVSDLKSELVELRKQTNKVKFNFAFRCNTMIEYANDKYSIQLARSFFSSLEEDFEAAKKEYQNSFRTYLQRQSFIPTDVTSQLKIFSTKFYTLKDNICAEFADPLFALDQLKSQMITCFNDATKELDVSHSSFLIYNFFQNYKFYASNNAPYLDKLIEEYGEHGTKEPGKFVPGANITQFINKFYDVKHKGEAFNLDEEGKWTRTLIPGHIIKPILTKINIDKFQNKCFICIDWQTMNSKYETATPEEQAEVTAHYYLPTKDVADKIKSYKDYLALKDNQKQFLELSMKISPEAEVKNLQDTYSSLIFSFTDNHLYHAYEVFYPCLTEKASVARKDLSDAGLVITDNAGSMLLRDIIEKIEKHKPDFDTLTLKEKFVWSANFYSMSKITDDTIHAIDNQIYATYKNSSFSENNSALIKEFNWKGLLISQKFWKQAKKAYTDVKTLVDSYVYSANGDLYCKNASAAIQHSVMLLTLLGLAGAMYLMLGDPMIEFFSPGVAAVLILCICNACVCMAWSVITLGWSFVLGLMLSSDRDNSTKFLRTETYRSVRDNWVYEDKQVILYSSEFSFRAAPLKDVMDSYNYFSMFDTAKGDGPNFRATADSYRVAKRDFTNIKRYFENFNNSTTTYNVIVMSLLVIVGTLLIILPKAHFWTTTLAMFDAITADYVGLLAASLLGMSAGLIVLGFRDFQLIQEDK